MQDAPISTRGSFWLISATFLLFLSAVLYLYDADRQDSEIIKGIESEIQEDLTTCIKFYQQTPELSPGPDDLCQTSRLLFNEEGKLVKWTREQYLPAQRFLDRLKDISNRPIITLQGRSFYQMRKAYSDSTVIHLLPLHIQYQVKNEFLVPYVFMGRHRKNRQNDKQAEELRGLIVNVGNNEYGAQIQLLDVQGRTLLSIDGMEAMSYRIGIRYTVLLCFILSLISFGTYLRIYTIRFPGRRYWVNIGLFFGILLLRGLLYLLNFPGEYMDARLFSPDVLAFHSLAPSLGEMTLNILTLLVLVFIAYLQFRRTANSLIRKIIGDHLIAWPAMVLTTAISSFLLYWYYGVFMAITKNSLVEIEFSNIFKTDIYSFLILLDVGMLLLACILVMQLLLRLNMHYFRRYRMASWILISQAMILIGLNFYLNIDQWEVGLINTFAMASMLLALYRFPFNSFFKQDLINYIFTILVFSTIVTFCVEKGVSQSNYRKATQIAQSVLGSQAANTVFGFEKATTKMSIDMRQIQFQYRNLVEASDFSDWLVAEYLDPNFKEFDVSLYLYDESYRRLDKSSESEEEPEFGPDYELQILEKGGEKASENVKLYRLPNSENKYLDTYLGSFDLILQPDSGIVTHLVMELQPSSNEARGLYPSLSMDQNVYEDLKRINSLDYAVYRDRVLFVKKGETSFPTILNEEVEEKVLMLNRENGYYEYIEPIENGRTVLVRYPAQSFFEVVTTFSFIFYYYILATLLFIWLPYALIRRLRRHYSPEPVPLRSKIRYGLLIISILPMIVIIGLLYPFVSAHYYEDTEEELVAEADRLASILEKEYLEIKNDPYGRLTLLRDFSNKVENLEQLLLNDINVYDGRGRRIASTQPQISETGIYTDLMPVSALDQLSQGQKSELVLEENIGRLEFLSAYRPIVGSNGKPAGYINIPYLAKQDQLENQVIEFLAYLANIYLLVFLLLNVIAVLVSNTITQPLAVVQQRLSATTLGEINEPIQYNSRDEIGAIVAAYNQMVSKLEASEEKIAANQRELAWRQMARQVAHEIKNPLTPMRLSIQHLRRAHKEKKNKFEEMFPKVMNTLLVQIDSLVTIANSFSEFAKMPEPVKMHVDVSEVLTEVVDLYSQSDEAIWLIDIPNENFISNADRDQLSRCFNNIIKNGLQAIEENGIMHVSMRILHEKARIEIKDNGKGMSEEVQKRIFEPSFSTKTSGMGLGLAIVKKIIENIGGSISFRSEQHVGTTFIIEIPSVKAQEEMSPLEKI